MPPGVSGVKQDGEVADLLRNLVRRNRQRGADAERHGGQNRRGDNRTIDEIVEGVSDEHREHGAVVHLAVVRVTVPPQHELFKDEEQEDAEQQRSEDSRRGQLLERTDGRMASVETPRSAPTA